MECDGSASLWTFFFGFAASEWNLFALQIIQSDVEPSHSKIQKRDAKHPLVAVFQPVLLTNEETLAKHAGEYYNQIKNSQLTEKIKSTLLDVFVSWLEQRFKNMGKKEIEQMLIGELPDLRETQSGKDLVAIGKVEGKQEDVILMIENKFGSIDSQIRKRIEQTTSAEKLKGLLLQVMAAESVDDLKW